MRFVSVGALVSAFGYGVIFVLMYGFGVSPVASNVAGYALGLGVSYFMHRTFTFRSERSHGGGLILFMVSFAVSYSMNLLALILFLHLGVEQGVSQILAGVIYVATSYILNRTIVFPNDNSA